MSIETPNLLIREFDKADTPALSRILGDPSVMEFSSKGPMTEADTARFIEWCRSCYQEFGYGQWAIIVKESGELIGFCGLSHATVDGTEEVEIAYRLARHQWGKGLASEAVKAVMDYGFTTCKLPSVVAIVSPLHKASIRVLEKCGFTSFHETDYSGWRVRVYRMT
ncbi:GNAT family N-acetyltransferase [Marinobacter sp.]|uniref:GNAT family N-acetyltransferase n=1 Tax=Marinobacter sp. TaxID=50741 RepID=UPI0035618105